MIEFTLYGEPKPKGRPRMTRTGHLYTPKETRQAEIAVQLAWELAGAVKLEGMLGMECVFYVGSKRRVDCDNMLKLVQDALNKHAYDDDYQIIELVARRVCVEKGDARTVVKLYER